MKRKFNQINSIEPSLLVDKWQSAWTYRNYHVRVTMSTNPYIQENTIIPNAKIAALMLRKKSYFSIHKAIVTDSEIDGCYMEYTNKKCIS
jgi:hypothetical protein